MSDRALAPNLEVTQLDEVDHASSWEMSAQTPDEVHVDNPPDAASSILSPYPLISASNYLTVLPVETRV